MIGDTIDILPQQQPKKIDILRLYFSFPKNIPDSRRISSIVKDVEDQYRANASANHIKRKEMIRIKTKRLVKECKSLIAKRKVCLKSKTEKQKQEKFHRSIHALFDLAQTSMTGQQSTDSEFSDSLSSQGSDSTNDSDSYHSVSDSNFQDSDHVLDSDHYPDSDHDPDSDPDDDPDYDPSDDFRSLRDKIPIPATLVKEISDSNGSYRLCENILNVGVKIAGAFPKSYGISKSNLWKKITHLRSTQANDLILFLAGETSKIVIHFDGKSCARINERHLGNEERLIVLCHTKNGDIPLGFSVINSKSGADCANKILELLREQNLSNRVVGMVCDTENTNTGIHNGTIALLEIDLEDNFLHLMCRHHSKEVIVKDVFVSVFGGSQSSNITTFNMLIENWDYIRDRDFSYNSINGEKFASQSLKQMRQEAIAVISKHASKKEIRDDYREVNDLILKFLGIKTSKPFRVPGATNNARWMARIIYAIKTYLFRNHLGLQSDFIDSLERFCLFVALIYTKHWNRCPNVIDAPYNDIQLLKELDEYREIDIQIANAALTAHKRHLWYLSDELVVLSLFSDKVSNRDKSNMIARMTPNVEERTANSIKHSGEINDIQNIELHHFISPRSRFLFERLELDVDFLNENPEDWNEMDTFRNAKQEVLDLIPVVNDSAERAIQLGSTAITNQRVQSEKRLQEFIISKYGKKCVFI